MLSASIQLTGNAYVNCGDAVALAVGAYPDFCLEAWIQPAPNGILPQVILSKGDLKNTKKLQFCLSLDINSNVLFQLGEASWTSTGTVPQGSWTHVAVTYGKDHLRIYINGVLDSHFRSILVGDNPPGDLLIGAGAQGGGGGNVTQFFQGMIGLVTIWDTRRSTTKIVSDSLRGGVLGGTRSGKNLSGEHGADDLDSGHILLDIDFTVLPFVDRSRYNNPVTVQSGAAYCLCIPALGLQGSQYADCGATGYDFSGTVPYTVEGWIYPESDAGPAAIISKWDEQVEGEIRVVYQPGGSITSERNVEPVSVFVQSLPAAPPGSWYHFATTYDRVMQVLSLYINGNLQATQTVLSNSSSSTNLLIGAEFLNSLPGDFFLGFIQNVRVWRTCLTQAEIQQWMYNDPVYDQRLVAAFDFAMDPPLDTTGQHQITLGGGAQASYLTLTLTSADPEYLLGFPRPGVADYYDEESMRPGPVPPAVGPAAGAPLASLSDEYKASLLAGLEGWLARQPASVDREGAREEFEEAFAEAQELVRGSPDVLKGFSIVESGGVKRLIHHGLDGDTVIFEAPAASIDDCTLWWIGFVWLLTVGFFQALGLLPTTGNIATKLFNLVMSKPAVVEAMTTAIGKGLSLTLGLSIMNVIYQAGLTWSVIKLIFVNAGWWALFWVLKKVIALVTGLEAAVLLAGFVVWGGQLANTGLNHSGACPSSPQTTIDG
jgi:hypothetical protein